MHVMNQEALSEALSAFAAAPDRSRLERLLDHAGGFIISQAATWKTSGLAFADRCRELLTEMFLILREDFDPKKIQHPRGILAFVSLRLRRLTRPREDLSVPFGMSEDLPDHGRLDFTAGRLELVDHLVTAVRRGVSEADHLAVRQLEFAFLHVAPDLTAVSRFLAACDGDEAARRLETDKKRHQAFNRSLRARFERIVCADWREVLDWSPGERSHLAWRIISFSAAEAAGLGEPVHAELEAWRDSPAPFGSAGSAHLELISHGLKAWSHLYQPSTNAAEPWLTAPPAPRMGESRSSSVGEPAAQYGTSAPAPEEEDILGRLLGLTPNSRSQRHVSPTPGTAQPAPTWTAKRNAPSDDQPDEARAREMYQEIATEIRTWWLHLTEDAGSLEARAVRRARSESPCH